MQHFLKRDTPFSNKHVFISSMQYLKERNTYQLLKSTCPFKEAVLLQNFSVAAPGSVKGFFQNDTIFLFKKMRVPSNA
jgi:hypothetical protein